MKVERIGRKAGLAEGHTAGLVDGLINGIVLALQIRFGDAAQPLITEIRPITDLAVIQQIMAAIRSATGPDDVRRAYTPEHPA